ncbi:hypothetical protein Hgul01_05053 [Herpetosiphon gulosus]|uniref:Uncharacterized protein n=1 Tax=Herpetosiphon gulosus TaxID=1973496 RepID=A0ABP9X786_9CHLR
MTEWGLNARLPETWQRTYVRIPTMVTPLINRVVSFAATCGSRHQRWHQRAPEGAAASGCSCDQCPTWNVASQDSFAA